MNDRQYYSLEALLQSPKESKGWFAYREVPPEEARWIERKTGLDLEGYIHIIERDAINHIFKRHGEKRQSENIPITENDFFFLVNNLASFSDIFRSEKIMRRHETIEYKERIGNSIFFVFEEIRPGWRTIALKTMYKNRVVSEEPDTP